MKVRIYYEDTDLGGIVYHSNFIKYCERARSQRVFDRGFKFDFGTGFVVNKIICDYLKPAFLGDLLEVRSEVLSRQGAKITLRQEIFRIENLEQKNLNEKLFEAEISIVFVKNGKPARLKPEVLALFD